VQVIAVLRVRPRAHHDREPRVAVQPRKHRTEESRVRADGPPGVKRAATGTITDLTPGGFIVDGLTASPCHGDSCGPALISMDTRAGRRHHALSQAITMVLSGLIRFLLGTAFRSARRRSQRRTRRWAATLDVDHGGDGSRSTSDAGVVEDERVVGAATACLMIAVLHVLLVATTTTAAFRRL